MAEDICPVLEFDRIIDAVKYLDDDEKANVGITDAMGRMRETAIISESGLYSLILRSRKPEAKAFKRWVTHEAMYKPVLAIAMHKTER